MYIYTYINEWKYEWMNEWMYVCMFKMKGCVMVCHTVSGLKCGIRRTPPTSFRSLKKHVGRIFHVVRWNISQKFHALPPPQKNPGLKVGGCNYLVQYNNMYVSPVIIGAYCFPSGPRKAMGFSHAWFTLGYPKWYSLVNELTKNYGPNHHGSWENSLFLWPFSIVFCMFTRPGND